MTKLCPRGKAAAKRKFDVYPSAYANAYASKICAGKIKDPSGTMLGAEGFKSYIIKHQKASNDQRLKAIIDDIILSGKIYFKWLLLIFSFFLKQNWLRQEFWGRNFI